MRTLITCVVMFGATLLLAVTTSAAPTYCGDGPVDVFIYRDAYCPDVDVECTLEGSKLEGYRRVCTTPKECVTKSKQEWTDYPECKGRRIVSSLKPPTPGSPRGGA
jgi:hypothetical protein